MRKKNTSGFTIVELLIVIVVIGILAAITAAAYTGIQQRSRDAIRKNDLAALSKALKLWNVDKNDWMGTDSGCGFSNNGWGWVNTNASNHASYQNSITDCLRSAGYISKNITDPSGEIFATPTTGFGYMKYNCGSGDSERVFLYAKLETIPQSSTATDSTCMAGFDTTYGMNYFIQVK